VSAIIAFLLRLFLFVFSSASFSLSSFLSDPLGSHILSETASDYSRDGSVHSNSSNTVSGNVSEDVNSTFYAVSDDSRSPRDSRVHSGRSSNESRSNSRGRSRDRGNSRDYEYYPQRGARVGSESVASSSVGFVSDASYTNSDASSAYIAHHDAYNRDVAHSRDGTYNSQTDAGSAVSYGDSSSSGTVDYLYRSDILSADDNTANSVDSEDFDF